MAFRHTNNGPSNRKLQPMITWWSKNNFTRWDTIFFIKIKVCQPNRNDNPSLEDFVLSNPISVTYLSKQETWSKFQIFQKLIIPTVSVGLIIYSKVSFSWNRSHIISDLYFFKRIRNLGDEPNKQYTVVIFLLWGFIAII